MQSNKASTLNIMRTDYPYEKASKSGVFAILGGTVSYLVYFSDIVPSSIGIKALGVTK